MLTKPFLGYLSAFLTLAGYGPYVLSTLSGRTRPHLFSWFIWGTIATIIFFAQDSDNAGPGAWSMGVSGIGCFVIAGLAIHYGEKVITWSDWASFVAALAAIPLWITTRNALWAVVMVTMIDACGYYPTYRKSWSNPREENIAPYSFDTVKCIIALFALNHYSFVTVLSPAFIAVTEGILVSMILWRRSVLKAPPLASTRRI
jgi:hypothetical protein